MENLAENSYFLNIRIGKEEVFLSGTDGGGVTLFTRSLPVALSSLSSVEIIHLLSNEVAPNYRRVRLVYEADAYTFVPMSLFRSADAASFLSFQYTLAKKEQVIYNTIPEWDTINVFSVSDALLRAMSHLFPGRMLEHHMSAFLKDMPQSLGEKQLFVAVRQKKVDVIALKDGRLLLLNSFSYQTDEDICFHVLQVADQLLGGAPDCHLYLEKSYERKELVRMLENYLIINS